MIKWYENKVVFSFIENEPFIFPDITGMLRICHVVLLCFYSRPDKFTVNLADLLYAQRGQLNYFHKPVLSSDCSAVFHVAK